MDDELVKAIEALDKHFSSSQKWTKGKYYKDKNGLSCSPANAVSTCLLGGVRIVTGFALPHAAFPEHACTLDPPLYTSLIECLSTTISAYSPIELCRSGEPLIISFNDTYVTSFDDIRAVIDRLRIRILSKPVAVEVVEPVLEDA